MKQVDTPADAPVVAEYQRVLNESYFADGSSLEVEVERVERFEFYSRAKTVFAVVATGEARLYANIIIKKGVIGPDGKTVVASSSSSSSPAPKKSKR